MKNPRFEFLHRFLNFYTALGLLLWSAAFIFLLVPVLPSIYYTVNGEALANELSSLEARAFTTSFEDLIGDYDEIVEEEDPLPPVDKDLPSQNYVTISSIGVYSPINTGQDYETALKTGSWIVDYFGKPDAPFAPTIIASHRFGYTSWTRDFRNKISFYKLPETKVGDKIEVIWDQREYEYEIYKTEESTSITDYDADLILYTCKLYNNPVRIFRYARKIN